MTHLSKVPPVGTKVWVTQVNGRNELFDAVRYCQGGNTPDRMLLSETPTGRGVVHCGLVFPTERAVVEYLLIGAKEARRREQEKVFALANRLDALS